MKKLSDEDINTLGQLYAFLGNSFLTPMRRTETVGLDPEFWKDLAQLFGGALSEPALSLATWAEKMGGQKRSDVITIVSVEFTRLFVGPPRPAATPWETTNGDENTDVCFGEATFEMKERLRELGLALTNDNHQFEDHIGIELLYLSELCKHSVLSPLDQMDTMPEDCFIPSSEFIKEFIQNHLLKWLPRLQKVIHTEYPDGYFDLLLNYTLTLLNYHYINLAL